MSSISRASQRGFTLLEVMCAFAILAGLTGFLTVIHFNAMDRGTKAFHLRELREAADTVFRKILYEEHNWNNGDGKTLDQSYAEWANLRGWARDRWRVYRWELQKERRTAAGPSSSQHDEEPLFDASADHTSGTYGTSSTGSTSSSSKDADKDGPPGQALWRMTMSIYHTDESNAEPLLVLRTFLPVREETPTTGTAPAR